MKTLQIIILSGTLVFASISSKAQLLTASVNTAEAKFDANTAPIAVATNSRAFVSNNKAGVKALKHFDSKFKSASDVKWFQDEKVISARYYANGIDCQVVFNKNGSWLRNMNIYSADKMSDELKNLVDNSIYADYKINHIQEIHEYDMLFYVLHLENAKTIKQIIVYKGDIALYSSMKKQ